MFAGIIDAMGEVRRCDPAPTGRLLEVRAPGYWSDLPIGASVAIDGVCLTLVSRTHDDARFDVIAETLARTTLGHRRPGDAVNLQKSLAVGDRIDGHFVQGHVDAVATIDRIESAAGEVRIWFRPDAAALAYLVPKGGVAIDGISLTIVDVRDAMFSVALIPTTLERTTLGTRRPGDRVNVETDILARTVVHYLRHAAISRIGPQGP